MVSLTKQPDQKYFCVDESTKHLISPYPENFSCWTIKPYGTKEEENMCMSGCICECNCKILCECDSDDWCKCKFGCNCECKFEYESVSYRTEYDIFSPEYVCTKQLLPVKATRSDYDFLINHAIESYVGKGEDYVLDTDVRKSFEIKLNGKEEIELNPDFLALIEKLFNERSSDLIMSHSKLVPHKIVLYEQGSKFEKHRDAIHSNGMIGTLVVVLPCDDVKGGNLRVHNSKGEFVNAVRDTSKINCVMFYNDTIHEVTEIMNDAYRVSITFDIVGSNNYDIPQLDKFQKLIGDLRSKGITRFGKILTHTYHDVALEKLKSVDQIFLNMFQGFKCNTKFVNVHIDTIDNVFSCYDEKYGNLLKLLSSTYSRDDDEYYNHRLAYNNVGYDEDWYDEESMPIPTIEATKFKPETSELASYFNPNSFEFLGDVCIFSSKISDYARNQKLHMLLNYGNEGVSGCITKNVLLIVSLIE